MEKKILIGFSTGCFLQWNKQIDEIANIIRTAGADTIELSFLKEKELLSFRLNRILIGSLEHFKTISIHAPIKKHIVGRESDIIEKLIDISDEIGTNKLIIHPDSYKNLDLLTKHFDVFIENLPSETYFGNFDINSDYNFSFVFDIVHAFQIDKTYENGFYMLELMKDKIKEIHASGVNQTNSHCLLVESDYRKIFEEAIKRILRKNHALSIILEGKIQTENTKIVSDEFNLINSMIEQ